MQQLREPLPLCFKEIATLIHQYQLIAKTQRKFTSNEALIRIDFRELLLQIQ